MSCRWLFSLMDFQLSILNSIAPGHWNTFVASLLKMGWASKQYSEEILIPFKQEVKSGEKINRFEVCFSGKWACHSFAGGLVSTNVISMCPQMGGGACSSSWKVSCNIENFCDGRKCHKKYQDIMSNQCRRIKFSSKRTPQVVLNLVFIVNKLSLYVQLSM